MSLYKRKQIVKNKFDNIQKISNASIRTQVRDSNHSEIYLDINGRNKKLKKSEKSSRLVLFYFVYSSIRKREKI